MLLLLKQGRPTHQEHCLLGAAIHQSSQRAEKRHGKLARSTHQKRLRPKTHVHLGSRASRSSLQEMLGT